MAIIEVSFLPVGTSNTGLSQYIAKALDFLNGQGNVKFEVNSMGTVLEGDLDYLLSLVREMQEKIFQQDVYRLYTVMKIDDRRDKELSMEGKMRSLSEKMERNK